MFTLDIQIETLSPLTMRSDHAALGEKTARSISGSTLAGALASAHRFFYKEAASDFARFFLRENIQYPYAYPANCTGEAAQAHRPVYPMPKTAVSCKKHPGYLNQLKPNQHGIYDSLLDWASFKISGDKDITHLEAHQWCPKCGAAMEYPGEAYRYYRRLSPKEERPDNRFLAELKTRVQTRTGINRERDIVESGILYNREVIIEGTRFWGTVRLIEDMDLLHDFTDFLEEVNDAGLLRIGTGRTRGLGQINLDYHDQDTQETNEQRKICFSQRLDTFHDAVQQVLDASDAFYFAITLHSPMLRHDHWLRARTIISEEDLAELTGLPRASFQLWYQATSILRLTGWNDVWGTPRTQDYALDTGSVFLFSFSHQQKQELIDRLFLLEEMGIGLRRSEGFGRICISDPFHREGERV